MKMDVMTELKCTPIAPKDACATDIGREFVRQYYTLLSENPSEVHRFYSHESVFVHNDIEAIGQQKIQLALESIGFVECKVRIHSIRGSHSLGQGIVLQVCGEMQPSELAPTKRFIQTFVLCQQTPKKFFVQNDIFQFIDSCFMIDEKDKAITEISPKPEPQIPVLAPKVNGHGAATIPTPEKPAAKPKQHSEPTSKKEKENKPPKHEKFEQASKPAPIVQDAPVATPVPVATPAPTPAPAPAPMIEEPKTWARLVGGGAKTAPTPAPPAPAKTIERVPKVEKAPVEIQQNGHHDKREVREHQERKESGSKLYIGGIVRNTIPDLSDEPLVIAEIIDVFSQFGEVDSVQVPRKVFEQNSADGPRLSAAFAFVAMKNAAEAKKVFDACRKDDANAHVLKVNIPSFGYDGEVSVSISEPRTSNMRGGYRPRGSTGRGGFVPRGGRGRGFHNSNN